MATYSESSPSAAAEPRRREPVPVRFQVLENPIGPRTTLVQVVGELDATVHEELAAAAARVPIEHDRLVIGLDECEFVDSTGVAAILRIGGELAAAGRELYLCAPRGGVRRTLELVGLLDQVAVLESVDDLPE